VKNGGELSSYRTFIEMTSEIIARRTYCYRLLVVAFSLILVFSLFVSILWGGFRDMILLLLFFPTYILYLVCDDRTLNNWRSQILASWKVRAIDLSALEKALLANKMLPPPTLKAMLDTLPRCADLIIEQSYTETLRGAVADTFVLRSEMMSYRLIRNMLMNTIASMILITNVLFLTWIPVLGVLLLPIVALVFRRIKHNRQVKLINILDNYRQSSGFDETVFKEMTEEAVTSATI
jgi:hypothetical protein